MKKITKEEIQKIIREETIKVLTEDAVDEGFMDKVKGMTGLGKTDATRKLIANSKRIAARTKALFTYYIPFLEKCTIKKI